MHEDNRRQPRLMVSAKTDKLPPRRLFGEAIPHIADEAFEDQGLFHQSVVSFPSGPVIAYGFLRGSPRV